MPRKTGFWARRRQLPHWLNGRQTYLYIAVVGFGIMSLVEGGWIIWIATLLILGMAVIVAFILRSQSSL